MSQANEHEKEKVHQKYGVIWLALSRLIILALIVLTVALVKYYRPLYETVDVIIMVAAGILLGAIFVQSAEMWEKSYRRNLTEVDEKSGVSTKPNPRQETKNHDARLEERHA